MLGGMVFKPLSPAADGRLVLLLPSSSPIQVQVTRAANALSPSLRSPRTLVSYVASVDLGGSIPQLFVDSVQKTQPLIIGKLRDQMIARRKSKK